MNHSDFKWSVSDGGVSDGGGYGGGGFVGMQGGRTPGGIVMGYEKLIHQPSKFFMEFSCDQKFHHIRYSPSKEIIENTVPNLALWEKVLLHVTQWCVALKQEIDAPDLWSQMEKYTAYLSLPVTEDLPNEPISAVDAEEIEDRLYKFADKVEKRFNLVDDDNKFLRNRIDYLVDAAKRSSKRDFVNLSIGVIATIAMSLAISPEKAKTLWQLFRDALQHFLYLK